jgi:hypothetical protein
MWHYSETISKIQNRGEDSKKTQIKNPLSTSDDVFSQSSRIKECVKALLCMGRIYVKLNEPQLAAIYFLKILEDRETLCKQFHCVK